MGIPDHLTYLLRNLYAGQKATESKEKLKSLLIGGEGREWKSWLKIQHSKNWDHGIWSHHVMANRRGKCGCSDKFPLWGLQNHCGWWQESWNLKMLVLWKKSCDKPRQCVEKQRNYSADQGPYSQGYGLSSGHIQLWDLDRKFSSTPKNWCLWTVVLETTPESPLDSKEIKPVNLKGSQPWILVGRIDAEAEAPVFWSFDGNSRLIRKVPDAGKDWGQKEKRASEDEMAVWHHWCNEHELGKASGDGEGQGGLGVLQSMELQRVRQDWEDGTTTTMVILCFSYWVTTHLTDFHSGLPFLQSQQYMRVPISLHLLQNLLFLFVLLVITIIVGVKWYLMVIFICISLMAKDVEHLFLCFLDICTSALEECLFKSFACCLIRLLVFLLLTVKCSLCILENRPLSDLWFANVSPILWVVLSISCIFKSDRKEKYLWHPLYVGDKNKWHKWTDKTERDSQT